MTRRARSDRRRFAAVVGERQLRDLLLGQVASGLGDWTATIAMMALVLDLTGSSTAVGGVLVLRLAPTVVAGPFATRLVRRLHRVRTMLAMDAARIAVVAAIPLVHALWWVYCWAFVLEACGLVFLPARDALIPDLLDTRDDESVSLANSLMLGASYGTIPLGAGVFSALAAAIGAGGGLRSATSLAFFLDAASFGASFAAISAIGSVTGEPSGGGRGPAVSEPFLGAFRIPLVRSLVAPALVAALGIGSLFSLGVTFVRAGLGASNTQFGVLVAMFGVGAALGLLLLREFDLRGLAFVRVSLGAQGAVVAVMSLSPTIALAFLGAVGFGAATAATLSASMTVLQEELEGAERVRAFAAFHVLIRAGLAVAAVAAGVAADLVSGVPWLGSTRAAPARAVLFASGVLVLCTALASGRVARRVRSRPS